MTTRVRNQGDRDASVIPFPARERTDEERRQVLDEVALALADLLEVLCPVARPGQPLPSIIEEARRPH